MEVGDVILVDDDVTGFEGGKLGRPYLVVRVLGEPPDLVYLLPRSTTSLVGVAVPARTIRGLNKDGKFLLDPLPVPASELGGAENLGKLPEPFLTNVTERMHTSFMELDE